MRLLWRILALSLVFTPAGAGSYLTHRDGVVAYDSGDMVAAYATYRRLAERGDARAQAGLALMFYIGDAVPQDHAAAAAWFRRAAEQGLAAAQFSLGMMYAAGQGVRRDDAKAYKWLTLAQALADSEEERNLAAANRSTVARRMAADQRAEGHRLACEWWNDNAWLMSTPPPGPGGCAEGGR